MQEHTDHFEGVGGLELFTKTWLPDDPPRATLVLIHGVGEHIDRYPHLVEALVTAGVAVTGYDQRGHGRSEGQRGHINRWAEFRQDARTFVEIAGGLAPAQPLFIFGHSQGSLIVLDYLLHAPAKLAGEPAKLAGAIISGAAIAPLDAASPLLVFLMKVLSGPFPRFKIKMELPGETLSRDPEVAQAYMDDPLVHWQRTPRWGTEFLKRIAWVKEHAAEINLPMLLLHGEEDPILSVEGARWLLEQIAHPDKTLHVYPESRHEPHNDLDHEQVASDVVAWINAHT